jgi:uncharacterized protein YdiU (UPF0061 family)
LVEESAPLEKILNDYAQQYQQQWHEMMSKKLGIIIVPEKSEADTALFIELETILSEVETDMTIFYRLLANFSYDSRIKTNNFAHFSGCFYETEQLTADHQERFSLWLLHYHQRIKDDGIANQQRKLLMDKVNPKYVLRNYLAQQAIELAEQGDYSKLHELQMVLKKPYDEQIEFHHYSEKRPEWARTKAGCSMLSCSS